jgi:predicted Zn-dependent peptidase
VENNLETLIDFVQDPYFSEKTVEKEKGIIGQEITMYDDNPDWRLYFGLIENMYANHPVKIDIAGTVESISHITKDLLYECYDTFYHPSNMLLFIVGPVNPKEYMESIKENQQKKDYTKKSEIKRKFEEEPQEVHKKKQVLAMNVQTSKCLVGIKAVDTEQQGAEMLKNELCINTLLDMIFSNSSENYQHLFSDGLIDDTFSYDYTQEKGFGFAMIGGDTSKPDELADRIQKILLEAKSTAIQKETLERTKKKRIGTFLRAVNSPEYIANQFTRYSFNEMNLFDVVSTIEQITVEDIQAAAERFIEEDRMTVCQVVPKA